MKDPIKYIPETSWIEAISMAYDPVMLVVSIPEAGASKQMTPNLWHIMNKYKNKVQVVRYILNDEYHEFALEKGITKFPCVMCMNREKELSRTHGFHKREDLIELVERYLLEK
mgnify:CR=1 FL=1